MVRQAIDTFGGLDTLVCNAGIVRDRMIVNMSVDEWNGHEGAPAWHVLPGAPRSGPLAGAGPGGTPVEGPGGDHVVERRVVRQRVAGQLLRRQGERIATFTIVSRRAWDATA